jgi:hypothetical protein
MGAEDWDDPHDIIPEQFRERFGDSETVDDALRRAESQPSTTSLGERPRCPECNSTHVSVKPSRVGETERTERYKCGKSDCMARFEEPVFNTAIPMNDNRTYQFDWIDTDELADPDERGESPLFATLDERTRTALAIVLCQPWHEPGASYREAAVFFPNSRYWIGRRVRAWKDGDHRELVPDPTAADVEPNTVDESSGPTALATDGGRRSRWDAYGS